MIGNDANFGKAGAATIVDPELLKGWGVRTHDYQTEITLQQEVLPRVSAEVSYIHRTFHGFMVTDNLGRNYQTDWVNYTITAPSDPRLPGRRRLSDHRLRAEHHRRDAELPDAGEHLRRRTARSATPSTTASTSTSTPACGTASSSRSARRRDAASTIAATW